MKNKVNLFLKRLFFAKIFFLLLIPFAGLTGPHLWRQIDTLGLSQRYYLKFFVEKNFSLSSWLPSILNSGESLGLTNSEFPIFAILLSPCFSLGPYYGQILASLLFLFSCLFLLLNIRAYQKEIFSFEEASLVYLVPLVSVGMSYFGRVLPDMPSALLFFLGVGMYRRGKSKSFALLLTLLSLLLKPTSILLYLLLPLDLKKWRRDLWLVAPVFLTVLYYKSMNYYLMQVAPESLRYASDLRSPFENIVSLKDNYVYFFSIILKEYILPFFPLILVLLFKFIPFKKLKAEFLAIFLYTIANILLLGAHNFIHSYYLFGLSFLIAIFMLKILASTHQNVAKFLFVFIIVANLIDLSQRLKPLWRRTVMERDCRTLKELNPDFPWNQNFVFRSSDQNFPALGVCFIERVGSTKAEFGFYQELSEIPRECRSIAKEGKIHLVKCQI